MRVGPGPAEHLPGIWCCEASEVIAGSGHYEAAVI